jgi:hypothetical protein
LFFIRIKNNPEKGRALLNSKIQITNSKRTQIFSNAKKTRGIFLVIGIYLVFGSWPLELNDMAANTFRNAFV